MLQPTNLPRSSCGGVFILELVRFSALVKLLNKSIEGTADDDEEGVTPDTAIRSGLELLKVLFESALACCCRNNSRIHELMKSSFGVVVSCRSCHSPTPQRSTLQKPTSLCFSV